MNTNQLSKKYLNLHDQAAACNDLAVKAALLAKAKAIESRLNAYVDSHSAYLRTSQGEKACGA
jgi:hypothetical protein